MLLKPVSLKTHERCLHVSAEIAEFCTEGDFFQYFCFVLNAYSV